MDTDSLYQQIKIILVEQFEMEESAITPEADLYEELELDSIDAVDLLVQLKELTGRKISPDVFKDVRTIRDVLDALTQT